MATYQQRVQERNQGIMNDFAKGLSTSSYNRLSDNKSKDISTDSFAKAVEFVSKKSLGGSGYVDLKGVNNRDYQLAITLILQDTDVSKLYNIGVGKRIAAQEAGIPVQEFIARKQQLGLPFTEREQQLLTAQPVTAPKKPTQPVVVIPA
ncbi:unnamed protein product, partial [marine sediment metagenome]